MPRHRPVFITATDTHVGKTVTTGVIGVLLQAKGVNAGVMKPVQCAGRDAQLLKKILNLKDDLSLINPCFAPEPLSPHLALKRAGKRFNFNAVKSALEKLQHQYERVLIEGAGGLMVPLKEGYYNADLIKDLKADVIIVSRLGLGTINHTLLTINQARTHGLNVKGIIFCDTTQGSKTLPQRTNPREIEKLSGAKILGIIPYLKPLTRENILRRCKKLDLNF